MFHLLCYRYACELWQILHEQGVRLCVHDGTNTFPSYQCVYLPVVLISSLFRWSVRMLMPAPVHDVTGPAKACRKYLVLLAQVRPSFAPQQPVAIFDGRVDLRSSCFSTGTNCVNTEVLMT